jgi:hypothetical protein
MDDCYQDVASRVIRSYVVHASTPEGWGARALERSCGGWGGGGETRGGVRAEGGGWGGGAGV